MVVGSLERYRKVDVELSAGQVVGHGVLYLVDVGNPVVAAYVRHVEQVEDVDANPDAFEFSQEVVGTIMLIAADELILQADVDAFICRRTEVCHVASHLWRCHGEAVRQNAAKAELQLRKFREIVVEKQTDAVALVGRARHFDAVKSLLSFHQRETNP